jgi:hypothetical protein
MNLAYSIADFAFVIPSEVEESLTIYVNEATAILHVMPGEMHLRITHFRQREKEQL